MKTRKIWIARHAARYDCENKQWKKWTQFPFDTPLSAEGHMQAKKLADSLEEGSLTIISSPFKRAIETSLHAARKFQTFIKIDYGLSEWIDPAVANKCTELEPRHPHHTPEIDSLYVDESGYYLQTQNRADMEDRAGDTFDRLISRFLDTNLLMITHGAPVVAIMKHVVRSLPMPPVCSLQEFEECENDASLILRKQSDVSHLR